MDNIHCQFNSIQATITIGLSKDQIQWLQDALSYSAWEFNDAGDDKQMIYFLTGLHDQIEKQTGKRGQSAV